MAELPEDVGKPSESSATLSDRQAVVSDGLSLIDRIEREISGQGYLTTAAEVEGLALAGVRATLSPRRRPSQTVSTTKALPSVYHFLSREGQTELPETPVQLVAADHQDLVHHCLTAHNLAQKTAVPVTCILEEKLGKELGAAVIPSGKSIEELLGPRVLRGVTQAPGATSERLIEFLRQSVAAASASSGLEYKPVRSHIPKGCLKVLVTVGRISSVAGELLGSKSKIGLISVRALRPFPVEELSSVVPSKAELIVPVVEGNAVQKEFFEIVQSLFQSNRLSVSMVSGLSLKSEDELGHALKKEGEAVKARPAQDLPRIGISPSGEWARIALSEVIRRVVPSVGLGNAFTENGESLMVSRLEEATEKLETLVLFQSEFSYPSKALNRMKKGTKLIVVSHESNPTAAWNWFRQSDRKNLSEQEVEVWWISSGAEKEITPADLAVALERILDKSSGFTGGIIFGESVEADQITSYQVELLDPNTLESTLEELGSDLPLISQFTVREPEESADEGSRNTALREFYLSGYPESGDRTRATDVPLLPAVCVGLLRETSPWSSYPLYLPEPGTGGSVKSVLELLSEAISRAAGEGADFSILDKELSTLSRITAELETDPVTNLAPLNAALEEALSRFDVSIQGLAQLTSETESLRQFLPETGRLLFFRRDSWLPALSWATADLRTPFRRQLIDKAVSLLADLDAILRSDEQLAPEAAAAQALSSSMGDVIGDLIDSTALSELIPKPKGPMGLSEERRTRLLEAHETLGRFLDDLSQLPDLYVVSEESLPNFEGLERIEFFVHEDPSQAAIGLYKGLMQRLIEAFKSIRIASLECSDGYSPEHHDPILQRFSWESCSEEELLALPPVVVSERSDRLASTGLSSLNRILRSRLPIQVVIEGPFPSKNDLNLQATDFGYLGIAQRETMVVQTSLASPQHLLKGLRDLTRALRPGLAVISVPDDSEAIWAWRKSKLEHLSRALPHFTYDPSLGESWAHRFSLSENPEVGEKSIRLQIGATGKGSDLPIDERLLFVHWAALHSSFRDHFLVVPEDASTGDLIPIDRYLQEYEDSPPAAVPFLWVVDDRGELRKAAMTRDMAEACRSRQQSWHVLQELAGLNNEYVQRIEEITRQSIRLEMEKNVAEAREKARAEGAAEAIDRLVEKLTGSTPVETVSFGWPGVPVAAVKGPTPAPTATVTAPPEPATPEDEALPTEEELEEDLIEEAYIDSFLCTSCNDCINMNPLMFKYNNDKQAYIADSGAGTYLQLVKAAEVCPAGCIHPGPPRIGDDTATEEVIERAKAFQ